ncbi:hypothetical protein J6590_106883 [Homalodisca vitripennis]|nr:hypothetical protein J6590_106883 [Homalodisca vitripennis]
MIIMHKTSFLDSVVLVAPVPPVPTSNKYLPLANISEHHEIMSPTIVGHDENLEKLIVTGEVNELLDKKFNSKTTLLKPSSVLPGAPIEEIAKSVSADKEYIKENEFVICIAGTNNMDRPDINIRRVVEAYETMVESSPKKINKPTTPSRAPDPVLLSVSGPSGLQTGNSSLSSYTDFPPLPGRNDVASLHRHQPVVPSSPLSLVCSTPSLTPESLLTTGEPFLSHPIPASGET